MARPLRIEFPGAIYHVTTRGNRREPIAVDDDDRAALLSITGHALERFGALMLAYCVMGNHYHFVLYTAQPNLSRLMRHVNGVYTQAFNRRHGKVGHLFQGRFKAILVDRDAYLLEAVRYVELNPVRAGMVAEPGEWAWSSYLAHVGLAEVPPWLDVAGLHGHLLGHEAHTAAERLAATQQYAGFVAAASGQRLWDTALRQQIYLGDEAFVRRMQDTAAYAGAGNAPRARRREIPRAQQCRPVSLAQWLERCPTREEALHRAYTDSGLTMTAIAQALGFSVSRVSRLIARWEETGDGQAKDET